MKENREVTDTNVGDIENSIEKEIELLQDETNSLGLFLKCKGSEEYKIALEHILSDYKRVLKENEELNKKIKEQKECTFREDGTEECLWYCSNCHDEWLLYEGTPEENNLKYCPHCGAKVIKYESYTETEIEIANKMEKDYLKESEE